MTCTISAPRKPRRGGEDTSSSLLPPSLQRAYYNLRGREGQQGQRRRKTKSDAPARTSAAVHALTQLTQAGVSVRCEFKRWHPLAALEERGAKQKGSEGSELLSSPVFLSRRRASRFIKDSRVQKEEPARELRSAFKEGELQPAPSSRPVVTEPSHASVTLVSDSPV